jgi:hypothetical protein
MHKAVPVALAAILMSSVASLSLPMASAQSHGHGHGQEEHEGAAYMMMANGIATHIKTRTASESSLDVHMVTTKANNNVVSFKVLEGELQVGEDAYSVVGGKANLSVKSGRLGLTITLKDDAGKNQLLRITATLSEPLPHEEDDPAPLKFKVAKALRFWKLDMRGEVVLPETGTAAT